jgi:hypothetical protein
MQHVRLDASCILNDPAYLKDGARLFSTDEQKLGITIKSNECRVEKPDGSLLFMLLKDVIEESIWEPAYKLLRTVEGDVANRPNIIGQNLRMAGIRKNGTVSNWMMAPKAVASAFGGEADLLGYYRYKNLGPGRVNCAPTAWTSGKNGGLSPVYSGCFKFIQKVDEVYRTMLDVEYKRQQAVVSKVPKGYRILDTVFTTLYVLKNAPTAIHTDDFDANGTFGCMASLGEWTGNVLVFPKYRIGCDYRPGDVILADVHEFHGNLPLLSGERVSCVFFVRTGMDQCP